MRIAALAVCGFLFISLAAAMFSSAQTETDVPGENLPTVPITPSPTSYQLENFSLDALLEFKSTGRARIKVDYAGPNPLLSTYYYTSAGGTSFTASAALATSKSMSWDIDIELSSPGDETLTITASGWLVLPLTEQQKQDVSLAAAGYSYAPGLFNQQALQYIQNQLKYTSYGIEVTSLNVTQFDWDGAASKLTFAATVTAKGTMFEESLLRELPASITTSGTGSIPTTTVGSEGLTLDFLLRIAAKTAMVELQMNLSELTSTIGFDSEFELRTDNLGFVTRTDNMVMVDFNALRGYLPAQTTATDLPGYEDVSFTLRVPTNAEVENLPSGYTQTDSAYTWTGSSAINAILALISGESGTRISYWVGPASVTVENIQSSIGQTIEVENNNVETVEIESEQVIVVNFERNQPVRRVGISFVAGVDNINVQAQRLSEKPSEAVDPPAEKGIVCYYLEMETTAPEQVENAAIEFKVPKLWIRVNNIDQSTLKLLRYQDGQWADLNTTKIAEDDNDVYFSAEAAGFSLFAVTAEPIPQSPSQPFVEIPPLWVIVITAIVLVAVIIVVVLKYSSRGGKELSEGFEQPAATAPERM